MQMRCESPGFDARLRKNRCDSENHTDRIPEPVLGALLRRAMHFSGDIIAAIDRHAALLSEQGEPLPPESAQARLKNFLRAQEAADKSLPGFRGRPNAARIAQMARVTRRAGDATGPC